MLFKKILREFKYMSEPQPFKMDCSVLLKVYKSYRINRKAEIEKKPAQAPSQTFYKYPFISEESSSSSLV
jgi:hypothetical protein